MRNIYFKDEVHEREMNLILDKFNIGNIFQDIEYSSFAYVVGAIYKAKQVIKAIDEDGNIDLDILNKITSVFSHSEKVMVEFALQCFNDSVSDIKLSDVMRPLDEYNTKVIKQAIDIRY